MMEQTCLGSRRNGALVVIILITKPSVIIKRRSCFLKGRTLAPPLAEHLRQ